MRPKIGNVVLYRSSHRWYLERNQKQVGVVVYESGDNFWNIRKFIDHQTYLADNSYSSEIIVIANSLKELTIFDKILYGIE
jgi:hypothetical protein